jgi:D-sedoheptulose 7-phosphate isomerase
VTGADGTLAGVPLALLAGGLGTRMHGVSAGLPKALLDVAGRPFIAHQLELIHRLGVRQVVVCVGHLGDQIEAYVGDGRRFGLEVSYSRESARLLGTAGALKNAEDLLGPVFWVMYGDTYLPIDFAEVFAAFQRTSTLGLLTVLRNEDRLDRSNVVFRDGHLLEYDKRAHREDMHHIDYGLALLKRQSLARIPPDTPFDLGDLYHALVQEGALAGFEVHQRFYEIGSPAGLADTRRFFEEKRSMDFIARYLDEVREIAARIDRDAVNAMVQRLVEVRAKGGRLFILGVGGSAGNASHAVNDFRKICGIEAYAPTDNVSELTARINDDGWDTSFAAWLKGSRLGPADAVCVFSVGGGDVDRGVSINLVRAVEHAKSVGATVCGIVGRTGGYTAKVADACVVIPTVNPDTVTAHAEAFQAVVWHLLVSHPNLQTQPMRWESLDAR